MKVFGHPIHIILIHFPSALFPLDFLFSCLGNYFDRTELNFVSAMMVISGSSFGWLALMAGVFDLGRIAEKNPNSLKKALIHGGISTMVIIVYTVLAFIIYKKLPVVGSDGIAILILKFMTVTAMIIGNFFGAELILKNKVLDKE